MLLEDLFYYCESSPTGLRRMTDWCSGKQGTTIRAKRGDVTGSLCSTGEYYDVYDGKRLRRAHVVIWEIHYGPVPLGFDIDHKDGNSLNNKLGNLRMVTEQWNAQNQKMKANNISGVNGVHLKTSDTGYERWVAQWNTLSSARQQKSFSVNKYGNDEAFRLACEYRAKMIAELNAQGAGYTERHGT